MQADTDAFHDALPPQAQGWLRQTGVALERRRYPRTGLQMSVRCIRLDPEDGDVIDRLHVTDISRAGLGGVTGGPYYPGQRVLLAMPLSESSGHRNIHASVVRCRQLDEGYRIGLRFDDGSVSCWAGTGARFQAA